MDYGNAIVEIRNMRKMSQKKLAKLCGISTATLCNIEKGNTYPHPATIDVISDKLDVYPSELVLAALTEQDVEKDKWEVVKVLRKVILSIPKGSSPTTETPNPTSPSEPSPLSE